MEKWELAFEDYELGMKYKDIASKYDVSINTVKSWKSRKWNDLSPGATKDKGCTQKEKVATVKEIPNAVIELNKNTTLNEQQKLFCLYYLQSFNATQSYIKAYGCSYDMAMRSGSRLLRHVEIKAELDRLKLEMQAEQYYKLQDIVQDYTKQARADIKDYTEFGTEEVDTEDGTRLYSYVRLKDGTLVDGTLIQEIKQGKDGVSVKLVDKQRAMDQLIKLLPKESSGSGNITIVDEWSGGDEQ